MVLVCTLVVVTLLLLFWATGTRSRLIRLRADLKSAFAKLIIQLSQRHQLILQSMDVIRQCPLSERGNLDNLIALRNSAADTNSRMTPDLPDAPLIDHLADMENMLLSVLNQMLVLPTVRQLFLSEPSGQQLLADHVDVEKNLGFASHAYKECVTHYNLAIQQFPTSLVARLLHFSPAGELTNFEPAQFPPPVLLDAQDTVAKAIVPNSILEKP